MEKERFTFEVDRSQLFDAVAEVGDSGQAAGTRLIGVLLAGEADFFDHCGLAFYGITTLPTSEEAGA